MVGVAFLLGLFRCNPNVLTVFPGFRLRIHSKQEWSDLYAPENVDDLQKFFDYYLKGVKNDWTHTPTVRVSLLRYNKVILIPAD